MSYLYPLLFLLAVFLHIVNNVANACVNVDIPTWNKHYLPSYMEGSKVMTGMAASLFVGVYHTKGIIVLQSEQGKLCDAISIFILVSNNF